MRVGQKDRVYRPLRRPRRWQDRLCARLCLGASAGCPREESYTIVNEYRGANIPVFHFDVYRIEGEDDLYSTGYYDYLDAGYLLCEWSEKIPFALPDDRITVRIEKTDGADGRRITLALPDGAPD